MAGNFNGTIYGDNVDFSGGTPITGKVTTDGQLLIGATAAPNIRVATLTEGTGIDIVNAAGSITISFDGSEVPTIPLSFPTDSGTATPAANALTVAGGTGMNTSGAAATVTINLDVPVDETNGGTAQTTYATGDILYASAADTLSKLTIGSAGEVLTVTGGVPTWEPAAGGAITWNEVTGTSQNAAVNNAYIANNGSLVTITLPSTFAVGDIVWVVGKGSGLWRLAANTGDTIHFGSQDTTAGGSLTATNRYDAVQVVGMTANSDWVCTGISQGNLTVA